MVRKDFPGGVGLAAVAAVLVGMGVFASSAMATCTPGTTTGCQLVSGTAAPTLSLNVSTPATFGVSLAPGSDATSTGGALAVVDTNSTWTLQAQDANSGANAGHMLAAGVGCSGSEGALSNPLGLTVTGASGVDTPISLTGAAQTVETGTGPLVAGVLTTSYTQDVGSSEALLAGCLYSLTTTYTLQ